MSDNLTHFSLSLILNGISIDYSRTERADGTVVSETGLPPGCTPKPSLADLFAWAQQQNLPQPRKKVACRQVKRLTK